MEKLSFVAFVALIVCACNNTPREASEPVRTDLDNDHLNGMVQNFEETTYTADSLGNIGKMDSCCVWTESFDEKGFFTSFSSVDSSGKDASGAIITRTDDNKYLSEERTKEGKPDGGIVVTYDAEGTVQYAVEKDAEGNVTFFHSDVKMNEFDQPVFAKMHHADSSLRGIWTRNYIDGIFAGRTWEDSTGDLVYESKGEVNEKGLLAKMTIREMVEEDSFKTKVLTYAYDSVDDAGNWTQRTVYDEDGKVTEVKKRVFTYYKKE